LTSATRGCDEEIPVKLVFVTYLALIAFGLVYFLALGILNR
jgi:hypothetical protein